jgi:hypothetical protein
MPNYKSVKIIFDLEDEHQKMLYEFLKKRSNRSSYIRTLLYNAKREGKVEPIPFDDQTTQILNTEVQRTISSQPIRIKVNSVPIVTEQVIDDEDIILDGLL